MSIADIAKNARTLVRDNSPALLTGFGVAGVFVTSYLGIKATPEALRRIWEAESEHERRITNVEKAKLVWPLYVPAAISAATSVTCILAANSISSRRTAVALGALSVSETSYKEYREKTREVVGEKEEQKIRHEIAQDHVNKINPALYNVEPGKMLCLDDFSQRVFLSDYEALRKAQNDANQMCLHEDGVALNEFYHLVGLKGLSIGYDLGWNTDEMLDLDLDSCLLENGEPAIHVKFKHQPKHDYDRIWR